MRGRFIFSRSDSSKTFRILLARNSNLAFTLIEVLIVIALIGILSGTFLVLINPKVQLEKARDSQRKSHLRQIQSALEVYRADCGVYPAPASNSLGSSLTASCNGSSVTYMQAVPVDPETSTAYYYCTSSCPGVPAGRSYLYSIYACLENDEGEGPPYVAGCTRDYIRYQD